MMSVKKKWLIALTLAIMLSVSSMLCLDSSAVFYDSEYPTDIGIESGLFLRFTDYDGRDCVLMFSDTMLNNVILMSDLTLLNVGSSTINSVIFIEGTQYQARFQARNYLQYARPYGTSGIAWEDVYIDTIDDMNFNFNHINPDNPYVNNNLDFSRFEVALLGVLIALLFFAVMRWYLLHKH